MKKLVLTSGFLTVAVLAAVNSIRSPQMLSTQQSERIVGGAVVACAIHHNPEAAPSGCLACLDEGLVTFTINGQPVQIHLWSKCQHLQSDEQCITGPTYLRWCSTSNLDCPNVNRDAFQDAECSVQVANSYFTGCNRTYVNSTSLGDPGLTCTGT